jgi:hypothetical protein
MITYPNFHIMFLSNFKTYLKPNFTLEGVSIYFDFLHNLLTF